MNLFQRLVKKLADWILPKEPVVENLGVNPYKFMLDQLDAAYPQHVITPTTPVADVQYKAGQRQVIEWIRTHSSKWR